MRVKLAAAACLLFITVPCFCSASPQQTQSAPPLRAQSTQSQTPASKPIDTQIEANIIKLLRLMHITEAAQQANTEAFRTMRTQLIAALPPTPHRDEVLGAYETKLAARLGSEDFLERTTAVYARYLSNDDVSALIELYQSPAGQHVLAVMPRINAEASQIDGEFVRESLPGIYHELCTEFPELQGKAKFCSVALQKESSEFLRRKLVAPAGSLSLAARTP